MSWRRSIWRMCRHLNMFRLYRPNASKNSGCNNYQYTFGFQPYITETITYCAQTLQALRVLRCYGLPGDALQTVYRAIVVAKLLYACPAWRGFITASDRKRVDAASQQTLRFLSSGFCPLDLQPFNDLIEAQEDQLFSVINHNPHHLLHHLLPPPSVACQNYELRHRIHNRSLPDRAGHL